jgi:hypothetical protein
MRADDPDLRIGMASLLGSFPTDWTTMSAPMADQLTAERVPEVAGLPAPLRRRTWVRPA